MGLNATPLVKYKKLGIFLSLGKINFTPSLVLEESFQNVSFWEFLLDLTLTPVVYLRRETLPKVLTV